MGPKWSEAIAICHESRHAPLANGIGDVNAQTKALALWGLFTNRWWAIHHHHCYSFDAIIAIGATPRSCTFPIFERKKKKTTTTNSILPTCLYLLCRDGIYHSHNPLGKNTVWLLKSQENVGVCVKFGFKILMLFTCVLYLCWYMGSTFKSVITNTIWLKSGER